MYTWTSKRNGSPCGFLLTYWERLNTLHRRMGARLTLRSCGLCVSTFEHARKANEVRKAFKYRLYPTKKQEQVLFWTLARCRELYNAALSEWKDTYQQYERTQL